MTKVTQEVKTCMAGGVTAMIRPILSILLLSHKGHCHTTTFSSYGTVIHQTSSPQTLLIRFIAIFECSSL